MEKKLEDYAHLYIGCEFMAESEPNSKEPNIETIKSVDNSIKMVNFGHGDAKLFTDIKLLLRPLSTMTDDEVNELWDKQLNWNEKYHNKRDTIFSSGFDDCQFDLYDAATVAKYCLSKGFDLFKLIPAGLAIDATKLQTGSIA
jgi:hypothetical protein